MSAPAHRARWIERVLFEHPLLYRFKRFVIERVIWDWILSGILRLSPNPLPEISEYVRGRRVLLAACGPGDVSTGPPIEAAADVVAFDLAPRFAAACRRHRPHWHVYCGDVTQIPCRSRTFDVAVLYSSLHHIPANAAKVLAELARVTHGRIIILEGVLPPHGALRHALRAWYALVDGGVHYYTRSELETAFQRLQLRPEHLSAHGPIRHMLLAVLKTPDL
ncbi:MAG TPA: class I SAM-dependent methyltransferase [Phycisphaerae bacterium]